MGRREDVFVVVEILVIVGVIVVDKLIVLGVVPEGRFIVEVVGGDRLGIKEAIEVSQSH